MTSPTSTNKAAASKSQGSIGPRLIAEGFSLRGCRTDVLSERSSLCRGEKRMTAGLSLCFCLDQSFPVILRVIMPQHRPEIPGRDEHSCQIDQNSRRREIREWYLRKLPPPRLRARLQPMY